MTVRSQNDQIKKHLELYGSITPLLALDKYGCFRLAARINDLRRQGMEIRTKMIETQGKKYAQYWYIPGMP
jgi:hypothetical protein